MSRPPSQATQLVELAGPVELFHSIDGEPFATFDVEAHRETWAIRTGPFRRWLARRYYEQHGAVPNSQATQDAIAVLAGRATFDGPERPVAVRVAEADGAVFLDVGDPEWRAVEIRSARRW